MPNASGSVISELPDSTDSDFVKTPFVELSINGTTLVLNNNKPGYAVGPGTSGSYYNTDGLYLLDFAESVSMGSGEGSVASFNIIDTKWDALESLITEIAWDTTTFPLMYRFGWRDANRINVRDYPWHRGVVSSWQVDFIPMLGSKINMQVVDLGVVLRSKGCANDSFDPTWPVSYVIGEVTSKYGDPGVIYDIEYSPVLVGPHNTMQGNTPMAYIRKLMTLAGSGINTGYVMAPYIGEDGMSHIYIGSDSKATFLMKRGVHNTYVWGRKSDSPALNFNVNLDAQQLIKSGARSTASLMVDPITKLPIPFLTTQDQRERDKSSKGVSLTPYLPDRYVLNPHQTPMMSINSVGRDRSLYHNQIYTANLTIIGDPLIYPLSHVGVIVLKDSQFTDQARLVTPLDVHKISGLFQVTSVQHSVTPGQFNTTLELRRNGSAFGSNETGKIVYKDLGGEVIGSSRTSLFYPVIDIDGN